MVRPADMEKLARLIRYYIVTSTTTAGSGHATSSLSAVELATTLFFKYFRFDFDNPHDIGNDRFILSKGHASPLYYSLFTAAGVINQKELLTLRQFESVLEGHPTPRFKFTEAPTGSLGQGLSLGIGVSLGMRTKLAQQSLSPKDIPKVYVLIGDGEFAEGQNWEALQLAAYHKLNNIVAILDVNRLGQSQETMLGSDVDTYARRVTAFNWRTYVVADGHDLGLVDKAFSLALEQSTTSDKPAMIIARTVKGKGISFVENKDGWHGKPLSSEELTQGLKTLGQVDTTFKGDVAKPQKLLGNRMKNEAPVNKDVPYTSYASSDKVPTRKAYGTGLVRLGKMHKDVVALDGDVKNSTYALDFAKAYPERYFEMFIAEQNMVTAALGLARQGLTPFVSTFACFLLRAADQIRLAYLSQLHVVLCGSHAGVSIGEDGPSQMGLEDVALFRSYPDAIVLYPADAVATERLVNLAYEQTGLVYIRTSRPNVPILYSDHEGFEIGKSKVLRESDSDQVTIVAAGITVFEALKAYDLLKADGISARIIDCYSVKPIDATTLKTAAEGTKLLITVEDHYVSGGLGDSVLEALAKENVRVPVVKLAVSKMPRSGKPAELLDFEGISAQAVVNTIKQRLGK